MARTSTQFQSIRRICPDGGSTWPAAGGLTSLLVYLTYYAGQGTVGPIGVTVGDSRKEIRPSPCRARTY